MPIQREGLITVLADIDVSPGEDWEQKISHYLNSAQMILLLISSDFMDSNYCYGKEMMRAMERHEGGEARVIPIILRPVDWQGAPFSKLQALPSGARPVHSTHWHSQDDAFFNVASEIRKAAKELLKQSQSELINKEQSSSDQGGQTGVIIQTFDPVWYFPDMNNNRFVLIKHIKRISFGKQAPDPVNYYIKVIYGDDAVPSTAFFAGASSRGWGGILGGTKLIRDTLQQVYFKEV